nr:HEAT repeat domain-containing protein [Acidobacteriota bacterium]
MIQRFKAGCAVCALILLTAAPLGAQQAETRERLLAQGWSALAAGRIAAAAVTAARLLKTSPRDHDTASLAVAADLAGPGPVAALDTYERWLTASQREDPFLLEEVGAGVLRTLSRADEPRIGFAALAALGRFGAAAARERLASVEEDPNLSVEGEAALAEAGSPVGFERLRTRISAGGRQDKSRAIAALKMSKQPGAASAIAEALKDPAPPSRIAAATALAELNATDAIPQLRAAAADPEPSVRGAVQIALGLLGDPEGRSAVDSLA